MKTKIVLFTLLVAGFSLNASGSNDGKTKDPRTSVNGTTEVFCTPGLYDLTKNLADDFCIQYPDAHIKVVSAKESSLTRILNQGKYLGFISFSDAYNNELDFESLLEIEVGRDVIIPVINSKNPFFDDLSHRGISPESLARIFKDPDSRNWGTLLDNNNRIPINFYMIYDESIVSGLAQFLNINIFSIDGIQVENGEELITSIQNDPYSIGFCKLIQAVDQGNQRLADNINFLPIDRNNNGEIDYIENIYDDLNSFTRGVWIGKYPKTLLNNIYSVFPPNLTNETQMEFMKWVLTDGQQVVYRSGYTDLAMGESQRKLDKLLYSNNATVNSSIEYTDPKLVIMLAIVAAIIGISIAIIIPFFRRKKKSVITPIIPQASGVFNENSILSPKGLFYDKSHTWVFMEKNGKVRVGLDDFLQHVTGPLTQIKLINPGKKFKKGDAIFTVVQNGKQLQINAPVSGTIVAQNKDLLTDSTKLNSDPYEDGWIYLIEPERWFIEIRSLVMANKYKEWIKTELSRIKDFLSVSLRSQTAGYPQGVFQEGGELKDNILADFGPEIWEDFQTDFIDISK